MDKVAAVSDIQALLECRFYMYRLMHCLFAVEPSESSLGMLVSEDAGAMFNIYGVRPPGKCTLKQALIEYAKLFASPARLPAPPWGSVHKSGHRVLFQPSTLEVRRVYVNNGFITAGYPNEADDHLATELDFMAHLAEKTLSEKDTCAMLSLFDSQKSFLRNHLDWVGNFTEEIDGQYPFYKGVAVCLAELLKADIELIDDIIEVLQKRKK